MTVFEFKRPAENLPDQAPDLAISAVASQTLRWGRAVLLEHVGVESPPVPQEIAITVQREVPHAILDGRSDLIVAFERSVITMFDFGLECVRCGPEFAREARFPEAPLASARLAGSHDVPLDVVVARHVMGSEAFWGWVADVIGRTMFSCDPQIEDKLRFALLEEARSMQAGLLSRVLREVPAAHARGAAVFDSPEFDLSQLTAVNGRCSRCYRMPTVIRRSRCPLSRQSARAPLGAMYAMCSGRWA
jgi:hypothetical protein